MSKLFKKNLQQMLQILFVFEIYIGKSFEHNAYLIV
jgi:hypothetical protein